MVEVLRFVDGTNRRVNVELLGLSIRTTDTRDSNNVHAATRHTSLCPCLEAKVFKAAPEGTDKRGMAASGRVAVDVALPNVLIGDDLLPPASVTPLVVPWKFVRAAAQDHSAEDKLGLLVRKSHLLVRWDAVEPGTGKFALGFKEKKLTRGRQCVVDSSERELVDQLASSALALRLSGELRIKQEVICSKVEIGRTRISVGLGPVVLALGKRHLGLPQVGLVKNEAGTVGRLANSRLAGQAETSEPGRQGKDLPSVIERDRRVIRPVVGTTMDQLIKQLYTCTSHSRVEGPNEVIHALMETVTEQDETIVDRKEVQPGETSLQVSDNLLGEL